MSRLKAIVQSAATTPSAKCWGTYQRVAVLVVDLDVLAELGREYPSCISGRARGVVQVRRTWENCNVGTTERCAYRRALAEAEALAARINERIAKGEEP